MPFCFYLTRLSEIIAPTHLQLFNNIKNKIYKGLLKPGDMLPSENELAEEYNISRVTVRKSLSLLEQAGYIYSAPGKGYFIREPVTNKYILSFNEMNNTNGQSIFSKLLEVNVIPPDADLMNELKLPEERYVIVIKRLFFSDNTVVAYDEKYMPYEKGLPLVEREIKCATFPELACKNKSLFSIKKSLKIRSTTSQGNISKLLNIEDNHPLLEIEQKLYTADNKVIGWSKTYYLSEFLELNAYWSFGQNSYEMNDMSE
ncbi:MAG: GntR family transcriptional regulator [Thermacetogeniaceae bacterium]